MTSYMVDCATYMIESGKLRRWERWVLCRIRERLVAGGMTAATRETRR